MSESLAQSFTKMVTLIESETKFLKGMASLRGSDTEVHNKLKSMNSFVSRLENNMNDFEAFVDQELQSLAAMEELGLQSEKQLADVLAVKENIPQFLNIDTQHFQQDRVEGGQQQQEEEEEEEEGAVKRYGSSTLSARKQTDRQTIPSERPPSAPSQPNISMGSEFVFITSDELEAVPKSTRGRLTLAQVTSALRTLVSLMEDKNKVRHEMVAVFRSSVPLLTLSYLCAQLTLTVGH